MAIIAIGIDRFPQINHILGHMVGERLLRKIGEQLKETLPQAQFFSKMGNNVFIALLSDVGLDNYTQTAEKIISLFEQAFSVYTVTIDLDPLIGFSLFSGSDNDASTLLEQADVALYGARYKNERYNLYNPEEDPHNIHKLSLMSEMREGLTQNEFEIFYQPQVNLQSDKVSHVEALARWHHPTRGFLMPQHFMPLAEETGHIKKLTLWLLDKSIEQCGQWQQANFNIGVAINLSVKDLLNRNLFEFIKNSLEKHQVNPKLITLEITESALMQDPRNTIDAILKLSELGLSFSIDDFGTGYSSLTYLKKLPINELKIDQTFIQEMTRSEKVAHIVQSTIEMAHRLKMRVVAEGIEDEATCHFLKELKCDLGQGYLFSHPISSKDFMEWLKVSKWGQ